MTTPPNGNGDGHAIIDLRLKALYYGHFKAVRDTSLNIKRNAITAFIGPSGCGKSTVLRCINRMNDLVRGFRVDGQVHYRGKDVYDPRIDPVATRKIEELMLELKRRFTIVTVTHNLQQAKRVADLTGFLYVDTSQGGRTGYLVEYGDTEQMFNHPREKHTQEYIAGAFS